MDLPACEATSDVNPHQYSEKFASGKKNLKNVTTYFPLGESVRVMLMEDSNQSSESHEKKLGFEGEDGPIEAESALLLREPWGFFLHAELEVINVLGT